MSTFEANAKLLQASVSGDLQSIKQAIQRGATNWQAACCVAFYYKHLHIFEYFVDTNKSSIENIGETFAYVFRDDFNYAVSFILPTFKADKKFLRSVLCGQCALPVFNASTITKLIELLDNDSISIMDALIAACKNDNVEIFNIVFPYRGVSWDSMHNSLAATVDYSNSKKIWRLFIKNADNARYRYYENDYPTRLHISQNKYLILFATKRNELRNMNWRPNFRHYIQWLINFRVFPSNTSKIIRFFRHYHIPLGGNGVSDEYLCLSLKHLHDQNYLWNICTLFTCKNICQFNCTFVGAIRPKNATFF